MDGFSVIILLWLFLGSYESDRLNPPGPAQTEEAQQERSQRCDQGAYENTIDRVLNCGGQR